MHHNAVNIVYYIITKTVFHYTYYISLLFQQFLMYGILIANISHYINLNLVASLINCELKAGVVFNRIIVFSSNGTPACTVANLVPSSPPIASGRGNSFNFSINSATSFGRSQNALLAFSNNAE